MRTTIFAILLYLPLLCLGQQYTGMTGLVHVPSADMDVEGETRIGSHFLNKEFLPNEAFDYGGKYHSVDFYVSATPFSWVEIGYTFTLRKGNRGDWAPDDIGFHRKDQFFSLKICPLREKEGKWWPSIAIGTNDPITRGDKGQKKKNLTATKYLATIMWQQVNISISMAIRLEYIWHTAIGNEVIMRNGMVLWAV